MSIFYRSDILPLIEIFRVWTAQHPISGAAAFFALYVIVTGLSVPVAAALMLLAGSLFGFVEGALLVAGANMAGSSIGMLIARYLVGDYVQRRFANRLTQINRGIEKNGALYLISLRLIPVVPFFIANFAAGLSKMPLRTFIWASFIGKLPMTFIYVFSGQQLNSVSLSHPVLHGGMISALLLLSVLPLAEHLIEPLFFRISKSIDAKSHGFLPRLWVGNISAEHSVP
eukprot:gene17499-17696_t